MRPRPIQARPDWPSRDTCEPRLVGSAWPTDRRAPSRTHMRCRPAATAVRRKESTPDLGPACLPGPGGHTTPGPTARPPCPPGPTCHTASDVSWHELASSSCPCLLEAGLGLVHATASC